MEKGEEPPPFPLLLALLLLCWNGQLGGKAGPRRGGRLRPLSGGSRTTPTDKCAQPREDTRVGYVDRLEPSLGICIRDRENRWQSPELSDEYVLSRPYINWGRGLGGARRWRSRRLPWPPSAVLACLLLA